MRANFSSLVLITPPTRAVLSLQEVKAHLRLDTDDEDPYVDSLIEAAESYLDGAHGILGRCMMEQTWEMQMPNWPWAQGTQRGGFGPYYPSIEIPLPPLISVDAVGSLDDTGALQSLDSSLYAVINRGTQPSVINQSYGATWPTILNGRDDGVRLRFTAGYEATSSGTVAGKVPRALRQYMLLLISDCFVYRESIIASATRNADLGDMFLRNFKMPVLA